MNPSSNLVSLGEIMEKFDAARIHLCAKFLSTTITMSMGGHSQLLQDRQILLNSLMPILQSAGELGLTSTIAQLNRIKWQLEDTNLNLSDAEVRELLVALNDRMTDDFDAVKFGFIPRDKIPYFDALDFGEKFSEKFPKLPGEVKQAGTCYAHGLDTACVFHLMRVMESGVQYFGKKLGVKIVQENPGKKVHELAWQKILHAINPKIKDLPVNTLRQKAKHQKYSEIQAYLEAVKDAWRNPTMHPRASYDSSEALNILNHVRSFMVTLAML